MRLDRFIAKHTCHSHQGARLLIAAGRVEVAGMVARDSRQEIDRFVAVALDGVMLQQRAAHYLMLHKPVGYLSATSDPVHRTVMELLPVSLRPLLHIGGRLDRSTSGLLLLTNDGLWSRRITAPQIKTPKVYLVVTALPITDEAIARFAQGMHFDFEGINLAPAQLQRLGECQGRLTIYEGRYHQVKRMFHAVGNLVTSLHRERMGQIELDAALTPGDYRVLTPEEIASV